MIITNPQCLNCYWLRQCGNNNTAHCNDQTPMVDEQDILDYEADLQERHEEYISNIGR